MSSLLAWLGVACLSGAWVLAADFYGTVDPIDIEIFTLPTLTVPGSWIWPSLALVGVALLCWVPLRLPRVRDAAIAGVLVLPGLLVLSWPGRFGPLLICLGLVLGARAGLDARWRWAGIVGRGMLLAGALWLVLGLVMFAYEGLTARSPVLPAPLTHVLAFVARLVGIDVAGGGRNSHNLQTRIKQCHAHRHRIVNPRITIDQYLPGHRSVNSQT